MLHDKDGLTVDGIAAVPVALVFLLASAPAPVSAQESPDDPAVESQDADVPREVRVLVQKGLAVLGYDPGPTDGLFGPKTRTAISDWQAAKGLDATGYLTPIEAETLVAVGQEASGTADAEIDVPAGHEPVDTATESVETTVRVPHFPMCSAATPKGVKCWISLTEPPDCDFHVGRYDYRFSVQYEEYSIFYEWSGECHDGAAHGFGTLHEWYGSSDLQHTGEFVDGVKDGNWIESSGTRQWEGDYVDGRRHGVWRVNNDGEVSYHEYRHGERID